MDLEKEIEVIKASLARIENLLAGASTTVRSKAGGRSKITSQIDIGAGPVELDFEMPARAFFNKYGQNRGGAAKFALVVAFLAKGDETKEISIVEIETHWGKMTSLLGAFNSAYPTRARDRDFVDSKRKGSYNLRPNWRNAVE